MYALLVGAGLVLTASVAASVALIFQKRAHETPPAYKTIQWWVGICLAACASVTDAVALRYIRTSIVGILACASIPINVVVSWWMLGERTSGRQRIFLATAVVGIVVAVAAIPHAEPTPDDLETFTRTFTCVFLGAVWGCLLVGLALAHAPAAYAVLAGVSGAQFVTYGTAVIHTLRVTINAAQVASLWALGATALGTHLYTLNVGLARGEAVPVTTTFQCVWCLTNLLNGIVVYGDMDGAEPAQVGLFAVGVLFAVGSMIGAQLSRRTISAPRPEGGPCPRWTV